MPSKILVLRTKCLNDIQAVVSSEAERVSSQAPLTITILKSLQISKLQSFIDFSVFFKPVCKICPAG